jgi:hypothetical protein
MRQIELKTIFAAGFLFIAPVASLSNPAENVFLGVDFLLFPITAKAACGAMLTRISISFGNGWALFPMTPKRLVSRAC